MKHLDNFTTSAQTSQSFARLSGDFNPLHLDPIAARRTQFGRTLIHGVCGTLQALDCWLGHNPHCTALEKLSVSYARPIGQGEEIALHATHEGNNVQLELMVQGLRCQIISLVFTEKSGQPPVSPNFSSALHTAPNCDEPTIDNCKGITNAVDLIWDAALVAELFPNASAAIPDYQLASLIATTNIVGMKCPGLHSVYSNLELQFAVAGDDASNSQLHYTVSAADARLNRVEIGVCNAYLQGEIEAFFRAAPAAQATIAEIVEKVPDGLFGNQTALIVGASRGLGEVIAKVLAAGGASVILTYARGADDAEAVATDIAKQYPKPTVLPHDVLTGALGEELQAELAQLTHVYYLASPVIEKGETNRWNGDLFNRFCRFYIDGLAVLLQHIRKQTPRGRDMHLFIPSSVFLEGTAKGFNEYIAAKAAAEAYAERFVCANKNWRSDAPRLPRLQTDQTSGVEDSGPLRTVEVIVDVLQELYGFDP